MKRVISYVVLVGIFSLSTTTAFAGMPWVGWAKGFEPKMVARTNQKLEKMMPIVERQVELLIKMIGNDKYRARLEPEFAKVIGGLKNPQQNSKLWNAGNKWSFLASVLKEYKAPLRKTCIGNEQYRGGHQPLNWTFPLEFLSGSMFPQNKYKKNMGFGIADLRRVDKSELIRMAHLSNQSVELQKMLRDGIEGKFDDDALQQFASYEKSGRVYHMGMQFGISPGMPRQKQKPCEWYASKGINARMYWPAIGYEMIVPSEIAVSSSILSYLPGHSFGGNEVKPYFDEMPSEYINAWKNLTVYYQNYLPFLPENSFYNIIERYDATLAAKTDEPLGDLMSEDSGSGGDSSASDDDDLALPSLD